MNPLTFIVSSPRSGSTWLRWMLGDHPQVAAGSESGLFTQDGGLGALLADFFSPSPQYFLRDYLGEEQVLQLVRDMAQNIYGNYLISHQKTWLVEKTPAHSFVIAEIIRVFPDARFIHLIRDGRDVAASIVRAGHTWKPGWPTEIGPAAAMWRRYNQAIMSAWMSLRGEALYVVRYEDLLLDPAQKLSELFAFIGVNSLNKKDISALIDSHSFDTYRRKAHTEFDQLFLGQGKRGDWRAGLSKQDIVDFKLQAGDLLLRYAYVDSSDWC